MCWEGVKKPMQQTEILVQAASVDSKLAIVFIGFILSSLFFLCLLLFTHFGETPEAEILFHLTFLLHASDTNHCYH